MSEFKPGDRVRIEWPDGQCVHADVQDDTTRRGELWFRVEPPGGNPTWMQPEDLTDVVITRIHPVPNVGVEIGSVEDLEALPVHSLVAGPYGVASIKDRDGNWHSEGDVQLTSSELFANPRRHVVLRVGSHSQPCQACETLQDELETVKRERDSAQQARDEAIELRQIAESTAAKYYAQLRETPVDADDLAEPMNAIRDEIDDLKAKHQRYITVLVSPEVRMEFAGGHCVSDDSWDTFTDELKQRQEAVAALTDLRTWLHDQTEWDGPSNTSEYQQGAHAGWKSAMNAVLTRLETITETRGDE